MNEGDEKGCAEPNTDLGAQANKSVTELLVSQAGIETAGRIKQMWLPPLIL